MPLRMLTCASPFFVQQSTDHRLPPILDFYRRQLRRRCSSSLAPIQAVSPRPSPAWSGTHMLPRDPPPALAGSTEHRRRERPPPCLLTSVPRSLNGTIELPDGVQRRNRGVYCVGLVDGKAITNVAHLAVPRLQEVLGDCRGGRHRLRLTSIVLSRRVGDGSDPAHTVVATIAVEVTLASPRAGFRPMPPLGKHGPSTAVQECVGLLSLFLLAPTRTFCWIPNTNAYAIKASLAVVFSVPP